jgi:hypothetical protein
MAICRSCNGVGSWYGVGPHKHKIVRDENGSILLSTTEMTPREEWPENFAEDDESPGIGVWICLSCAGSGEERDTVTP